MIVEGSRRHALTQIGDSARCASLPVINGWALWWKEWGPRIAKEEGKQPWILFILDAHERLMTMETTIARLLRNKPKWDTQGWTEQEWRNIEDVTLGHQRWFEAHCPRQEDVPEYAQFLLAAQYGLFTVLTRLGRELRAVQEQGFNTVALEQTLDQGTIIHSGGDALLAEVG